MYDVCFVFTRLILARVEPVNKDGYLRTALPVLCKEVVLFGGSNMHKNYREKIPLGSQTVSLFGRVHYRRFHCIVTDCKSSYLRKI